VLCEYYLFRSPIISFFLTDPLSTGYHHAKHKYTNTNQENRYKPLPTSTLPQNLTPNKPLASSRSASANEPRIILSTLEKTTWYTGASDTSSLVKASSSRTSPTWPVIFDPGTASPSCLTAWVTRSCEEEMMVTVAPASRRIWAAPRPILGSLV